MKGNPTDRAEPGRIIDREPEPITVPERACIVSKRLRSCSPQQDGDRYRGPG